MMATKLPVKRLLRLNLLLAVIVSSIVYLALLQGDKQDNAFLFAIMGVITIALIGCANILILFWLTRTNPDSKKFKFFRYLISYPVSVAVYLMIFPVFASLSGESTWSYLQIQTLLTFTISGCMINTLVIILHDLVLLQNEKSKAELELSRAKTAHAEAAILLLRQQIQPHFLFNALNILKSLYKVDNKLGDTYMVHLANFLRASISDNDAEISTLEDELKLLDDYLEMQKIRFGSALHCTVNVTPENDKAFFLPSFSLQPLLENAIKHNEFTEELPLRVEIYLERNHVWITNNLQPKKNSEPSTNSGLANLAERYKLLSGDEIVISAWEGKFSVGIKLLTNEYSNHRR